MSLSTGFSPGSSYTALNSGPESSRSIDEKTSRIVAGVESIGNAAGDVASATVTLSAKALGALADGGMDVVGAAKTFLGDVAGVASWPYEIAKDVVGGIVNGVEGVVGGVVSAVEGVVGGVAGGVEDVAQEGWHLLSDGVKSVVSGATSATHAVVVDLPSAIASDVCDVAKTAFTSAASVAGSAATVATLGGPGGAKLLSSIL
jgi:phage-related protein